MTRVVSVVLWDERLIGVNLREWEERKWKTKVNSKNYVSPKRRESGCKEARVKESYSREERR